MAALFFGPIRVLQALATTGVLGGFIVFAITDTTRGRIVLVSLVQVMTVGLIVSIMAFFGLERRGISLTAHKNSSLPPTNVDDYPRSLTWFKDRFIAVGVRASEQNGVKYRDGRVWQSSDGVAWNMVPHNHNLFGGLPRSDGSPSQRSLYAVATDGDKLIAVGSDNFEDAEAKGDASFWSSSDGSAWTKIQNATTTTVDGDQSLRGIAFGRGLWLAVGSSSGQSDAALWSSSDGVQWVEEPEIAPKGVEITSIGFAKGQWVAVGKSYNTDPNAGRDDQTPTMRPSGIRQTVSLGGLQVTALSSRRMARKG